MRIADITFHGAHNYGSVLQAYALQTFVQNLCAERHMDCNYKIINFRSPFQKEMYGELPPSTLKRRIKRLMELPYYTSISAQRQKFEAFLSTQLRLTEEINQEEELVRFRDSFDVFISGSDQIWNIRAADFSFAYLYEFTDRKKISYAASLGPLDIDWSKYDRERYLQALRQYSCVSVRENRSKRMVDQLLGNEGSQIHVDPTLLLPTEEWRKIQSDYNYQDGKYILLYCLEPDRTQLRIAERFSKKLKLPVVITGYRNKKDYFNHFVKCYDAGPLDFLSLIDHAAFVVTASFHGTAFSIIYNKPFCAINGSKDNRISNLLKIARLEKCAVDGMTDIESFIYPEREDASIVAYLDRERERSQNYLLSALGL